MAKTLYDKLWDAHLVEQREDGTALIYIDRHLLHEVTSPQAFEGLALAERGLWRRNANLAVPDHNVSTVKSERDAGLAALPDAVSRVQLQTLDDNCEAFDVVEIPLNDVRQGIVHVMGPEQGAVLPGMTVVCGDSHTSTHGAAGALAHGIGTSEVEHVLATQCLIQKKMKNFRVEVTGQLAAGVTAKDVALAIIGQIGTAGGTGFAIEFCGAAIRSLSMEGRMTLCNMAIEGGARCGLVAVDDVTLDYFRDKPMAPKGAGWDAAEAWWRTLHSDDSAAFDRSIVIDGSAIEPHVTWGTSPEMVASVNGHVPSMADMQDETARMGLSRALDYMGLTEGIKALVVPGSGLVKAQAEAEGLDRIFIDAGMEWREPGCSMCLAMNADRLLPGERCASTSNRNFEGRQGSGGRTHLVSPAMAAAAAVAGRFVSVVEATEKKGGAA